MKRSRQYGISLIEIMVTIAVVSILAVVAVPGVQALIENNRVRSIVDEFASSLYRARSEAVIRNNRVTMCASNPEQTNCDISVDDFSGGWIVFTDYDGDMMVDPVSTLFDTTGDGTNDTPEEILFVSGIPTGNIEIDANVNARKRVLTYRSNGLLAGSSSFFSFLIRDMDTAEQLAKLYFSRTGRIRQCIGDEAKCS